MQFVYLNDKFIASDEAKISVFDHGLLYGDAIYDTLIAYKTTPFNITAHLDRFFEGAHFLNLAVPYTQEEITQLVIKLLTLNDLPSARIRIYLSRGNNNYDFSTCPNPTFLITAIPIQKPNTKLTKLISLKLERPIPQVKSASLIIANLARQQCQQHQAIDALLINNQNFITEGSISNCFYIKNQILFYTQNQNLAGTTQHLTLEIANQLQIPTKQTNFTLQDLQQADEVFITSVLKHIYPITQIDDHLLPLPSPGPITTRLSESFTRQHITPYLQ